MRSFLILSIITFFSVFTLNAQPLNRATYSTMMRIANEKLEAGDPYNALEWFEKAYEENNDYDLALNIAQLHEQLRDYRKAESWYRRVLRRDKDSTYIESKFNYGRMLKMNEKYDEAIVELQQFVNVTANDGKKELARKEITGAEMAQESQSSKGLTVDHAGRNINTSFSEYSPILAGKGQMYFSGYNRKEIITQDGKEEDYHAKIFQASKGKKGWDKPTPLSSNINREDFHTSNVTLSPDGKYMFFTRSLLEANVVTESKIYFCAGGEGSWGPVEEVAGVNGEWLARHPAVGELFGNEVLFFISNMDGGYGGYDLYYATRKGEGIYGDPINMGPKLNTISDEETPFYRDGTLYFSSTGHPGYGGFDIFQSIWDGATWSEPQNMGRGYNSHLDDRYFTIDEEGYNGFIASNREGTRSLMSKTCCDDIFEFNIARIFADLVVGLFDDKKQPITGGTIQLVEMLNNTMGKTDAKAAEKGNRFDFALSLEMPYIIIAEKEGYYPDTIEFNTVGLSDSKTYEERFYLKAKPVPPTEPEIEEYTIEEPIELENIYYDFDDDRILQDAEPDLELVLGLMAQYPDMVIELGSHTDSRGDNGYNEDLSQRRAESARRWLVRKSVQRDRIQAKGYGENAPKTVNAKLAAQFDFLKEGDALTEAYIDKLSTEAQREEAHQINRRTEFRILEGPTTIQIKRTRKKTSETKKKN